MPSFGQIDDEDSVACVHIGKSWHIYYHQEDDLTVGLLKMNLASHGILFYT
uniref:Uncharacterized protein n=1 Tax=Arundo donax TaxID=35708 RepID=A0A0A9F7T8_ARUDO